MAPIIPYSQQTIEEDDIQAVVDVMRSPMLTTGPKVGEFEQAFATHVGAEHAVAVSSATAGLHIAVLAAGIRPGDEVLVPALSFIATANAVLYAGARPVFIDSLPGQFLLDPAHAERKITPRTKAIIAVHFAGQPADLMALQTLARKHRLVLIEDAAHALGAAYKGKPIGGHSAFSVFSFHPVKQITTGEGGMVCTNSPEHAKTLRRLRHHGIDVDVRQREAQNQWHYDMVDLGYNYRLTDLQCALGLSQLKKSDRFLQRREQIAAVYDHALKDGSIGEIPPRDPAPNRHAWHLYILRLTPSGDETRRNNLFAQLRAQGIGAHVHYQPIPWHSYYRTLGYKKTDCPELGKTFPRMLTLPLFPAMSDAIVQTVLRTLQAAASQVG